MNFIFEGTNGIGKDFLIDHLKNITKSVNVYRLPRYWFEHFCTLETYENLNILSYDILYSNMISNSRPNVMSIQYRSPLTGVIGNKFRWLEYPKVDYDVDPFIDFIMNRYTKNEMFVIFVFKDIEACLHRVRPDMAEHIININKEYVNMYNKMLKDSRRKFEIILNTGDYATDFTSDILKWRYL